MTKYHDRFLGMEEQNKHTPECEDNDRQSLWDSAGDMSKYNFIASLEGKSTFLWISAIILLVTAVILYLVMPSVLPGIDMVELDTESSIAVAVSSDTVYIINYDREDAIDHTSHDLDDVSGIHIGDNRITLFDMKNSMMQTFDNNLTWGFETNKPIELAETIQDAGAIITGGGSTYFISTTEIIEMRRNGDTEVIKEVPKIRYPSSITTNGDTVWMGDFDRIIRIDDSIDSITPFKDRPIKHLTVIDGNLGIIYENGLYIVLDDDGEIVDQKRLSSWTNYRQTAVSDAEGELTVSAKGLTLQTGHTTDTQPSKQFDIKREDSQ